MFIWCTCLSTEALWLNHGGINHDNHEIRKWLQDLHPLLETPSLTVCKKVQGRIIMV